METLRRTVHPEVRVLDSRKGICEYVASDETCDSYREIIRADSWNFDHFKKNAPFVDSHNYGSFDKQVGKVVDFKVTGRRLIETVQWAIDVAENKLAQLGWKMTEAGYLRAVSVGFWPERTVRPHDSDWGKQLKDLELLPDARVNCIYTRVQQIELSVCIIGANPNALAKAHTDGVLSFDEMDFLRRPAPARDAGSAFNSRAVNEMLSVFRRPARRSNDVNRLLNAFSKTLNLMQELIEQDRHFRAAVARLTLAKDRGDAGSITLAYREIMRRVVAEKEFARRNFIQAMLQDDETRLLWNLLPRLLTEENPTRFGILKERLQTIKRAIGEDTTPGSAYIIERMGADLYDLMNLSGSWATLGVRPLRSKSGKFPITTTLPVAQFILTEGNGIPEDTALAGSSLSAEAELLGVLLPISFQLWDDMEADIAADMLEKFERSHNALLDRVCFIGTGVADADNGGMTGIFVDAAVASYVAANGNTTVAGLQEDDILGAISALPAGAIQRGAACWMHPTLIIKAMKIKSNGQRIVKTALEGDTGGALFSVSGFPLHAVAAAPSTDAAASKVAAVGEPDAYLVGIRKEFTLESSGHYRWNQLQRTFRAWMRARATMRAATGFITLKTAAI